MLATTSFTWKTSDFLLSTWTRSHSPYRSSSILFSSLMKAESLLALMNANRKQTVAVIKPITMCVTCPNGEDESSSKTSGKWVDLMMSYQEDNWVCFFNEQTIGKCLMNKEMNSLDSCLVTNHQHKNSELNLNKFIATVNHIVDVCIQSGSVQGAQLQDAKSSTTSLELKQLV